MAAAARTLDLPQKQVLIDFYDDEDGYYWHHRVLCHSVSPGTWVAITPDLEATSCNLNDHRVIALPRAGPFPRRQVQEGCYHFGNVDAQEWRAAVQSAKELAAILGVTSGEAGPAGGAW